MNSKLHPQWIVGFVDGEGCFRASLIANHTLRFEMQIQPEFVVTQHKRDVDLLYKMKDYFQCGSVTKGKGQSTSTPLGVEGKNDLESNVFRYRVRRNSDLCTKIIPFFEKHSLKTKKKIEFLRFRKLCFYQQNKLHLTGKGFKTCYDLAVSIPFQRDQK